MTLRKVRLQEIANARSGDKGDRLNIALVCRDPAHYAAVAAQDDTRVSCGSVRGAQADTGGALRPAEARRLQFRAR